MLAIVDRVALAHLAVREQVDETAVTTVQGSMLTIARRPTRPSPAGRRPMAISQFTLLACWLAETRPSGAFHQVRRGTVRKRIHAPSRSTPRAFASRT